MRFLCVLLSATLLSCNAHSKDPLDDYHPEDHITVDENGKINVIEDESLNPPKQNNVNKGRFCLSLKLNDKDQFDYTIKKCDRDS